MYSFLNNYVIFALLFWTGFYGLGGSAWGWPNSESVVFVMVLAIFTLKALLIIARVRWMRNPATGDGDLVVNETDVDKPVWRFEWKTPLGRIPQKKILIVKVVNESNPADFDRPVISQ